MQGSDSATVVDLYNRQLHDDEKKLIEKKSNGNIEGENRLKKAACYEVKCWAQYPVGSAEYNENYVGAVEVLGLRTESEWVKNKKEDGYFNYSGGEKFVDDLRGEAVPAILNGVGGGVRSGIRTRSQPWPSRSTASCALLNADTARLTVLLDT